METAAPITAVIVGKFMVCFSIDVKEKQNMNFPPTANGLSMLFTTYHVASSLFARSFQGIHEGGGGGGGGLSYASEIDLTWRP